MFPIFFEDEYFRVGKCTTKSLKFMSLKNYHVAIWCTLVSSFTKIVFYRVYAVNMHYISSLKLVGSMAVGLGLSGVGLVDKKPW